MRNIRNMIIFSFLILLIAPIALFANYNPQTGRFLQRDPIGIKDEICLVDFAPTGAAYFSRQLKPVDQYIEGMSLYEYVKSNPLDKLDTLGSFWHHVKDTSCSFYRDVHQIKIKEDDDLYDKVSHGKDSWGDAGHFSIKHWTMITKKSKCSDNTSKIIFDDCSAEVYIEYIVHMLTLKPYGKEPYESPSAPKQGHEEDHANIAEKYWNKAVAKARSIMAKGCMCNRKAECYQSAISTYSTACYWQAESSNAMYDCADYKRKGLKNYGQYCNEADTYRRIAYSILNSFINEMYECNNLP